MKINIRKNESGFTLIELLVVIAIIAILSSIIFANIQGAILDSKIVIAKQDIKALSRAMYLAKSTHGQILKNITGSGCSDCICRPNDYNSANCNNNWNNVLTKISAINEYAGTDITNFKTDPWGHPYSLDENEGENAGNPCRKDYIYSVGPDGTIGGADNIITSYSDIPFILLACQ